MRLVAFLLVLTLLSACARPGGSTAMTDRTSTESAQPSSVSLQRATTDLTSAPTAEVAPQPDVRTATFALG